MAQTKFNAKQLGDSPSEGDVPVAQADDTMTWTDPATGLAAPGSNNQCIFNKDGVLGTDVGYEYDDATNGLTVGALLVNGAIGSVGGAISTDSTINAAGNIVSSEGALASITAQVTAGTYVHADTYVETNQDFRLISPTANVGGGLKRMKSEATSGALSGPTGTIALEIPVNSVLLGVQLRVDTGVTDANGPITWTAAYKGGSTTGIAAGVAPSKNIKVNAPYDTNARTAITAGDLTNINIVSDGLDFTAGVVFAIAYYEIMLPLDDKP